MIWRWLITESGTTAAAETSAKSQVLGSRRASCILEIDQILILESPTDLGLTVPS